MNRISLYIFVISLVFSVFAPAFAVYQSYPLEIFSNNGSYNDSDDIDLYVDVCANGTGLVDFTIHNESLVDSSIARIYFDAGTIFIGASINSGPGTSFSQSTGPPDLPGGKNALPAFMTEGDLSFGADSPTSHMGINQYEWVTISFDLAGGSEFQDVITGLDNGDIRVGMHLIALPDGSSEGAITIPEPITVGLLGLGSLMILRKKRQ